MSQEIKRIRITEFLQWNDRNGCYTDENCDLEDIPSVNDNITMNRKWKIKMYKNDH